jgi:hypothetical protein
VPVPNRVQVTHLLILSFPEFDVHLVGVPSDCRDCTLNMIILDLMVIGLVYQRDIADSLEHVLLNVSPGVYVRVPH